MLRLMDGLAALALLAGTTVANADDLSTDGGRVDVDYKPAKVVYDLTSGDPGELANVLARVSILQDLYGADPFDAAIIIMIHGPSVAQFVGENADKNAANMRRARDLTLGGVIRFAMCKMSANFQGYKDEQIQDFVTLVPMADAELVRLQNRGYAYLR